MSENTPQPAAPQQPQFTQQAPAAQPAYGAPVEAPKKKWAAVTALVLGIISALTGIFVIGSFLTIPTIIFAVIALVMVKNGTGAGKGMAITALVLVLVSFRSARTTSPATTSPRRTVSDTATLAAGSTKWTSKPIHTVR